MAVRFDISKFMWLMRYINAVEDGSGTDDEVPRTAHAGIVQMVERQFSKLDVAGSSPAICSVERLGFLRRLYLKQAWFGLVGQRSSPPLL